MSWGVAEEGLPVGGGSASLIDNNLNAWWVRIRKFMKLWVTDTSDILLGAGADEDNPKVRAGCILAGMIGDDALDSQHYVDGSVDDEHLANSSIGTMKLGDEASYESVQTRYCPVPFSGSKVTVDPTLTMQQLGYALNCYSTNPYDVGRLYLPVYLPHGAVVTAVYSKCVAYVSGQIAVYLWCCGRDTTMEKAMGGGSHSSAGVINDTSIKYATVDNESTAYYVRIGVTGTDPSINLYLLPTIIVYTVDTPLM